MSKKLSQWIFKMNYNKKYYISKLMRFLKCHARDGALPSIHMLGKKKGHKSMTCT
jgi:hypothetical protein